MRGVIFVIEFSSVTFKRGIVQKLVINYFKLESIRQLLGVNYIIMRQLYNKSPSNSITKLFYYDYFGVGNGVCPRTHG